MQVGARGGMGGREGGRVRRRGEGERGDGREGGGNERKEEQVLQEHLLSSSSSYGLSV